MWVPRWYKWLNESLRSESTTVHKAIEEQAQAIRVEAESRKAQQQECAGIIAGAIDEAAKEQASYEQPQRDKEYRVQFALMVFTIVAAGGAVAAAFGSWYYASIARGQLGQMITANQVARCATLVSTQSAAENAYYSREEERAWVELQMGTSPGYISLGNPGKTVAREVKLSVYSTAGDVRFGPMTISPYTQTPVPFTYSVPKQARMRGRITYVDVFGVPHWAIFCYTLGEKGMMSHCPSGNDEDHNLENPPKSSVPNSCAQ
jgi:hypothetical protein